MDSFSLILSPPDRTESFFKDRRPVKSVLGQHIPGHALFSQQIFFKKLQNRLTRISYMALLINVAYFKIFSHFNGAVRQFSFPDDTADQRCFADAVSADDADSVFMLYAQVHILI